jgi:uracil-DNA glycosylase
MGTKNLAYLNAMGIQTWQLRNKMEHVASYSISIDLIIIDETQENEPFDGRTGQLLNAMLQAIGFDRDKVCITKLCASSLEKQIARVKPKALLAMGHTAAQYLLDNNSLLDQLRGKIYEYHNTPLIVTYHPLYLLQNPINKGKAFQDLQLMLQTLQNSKTA